MTLALVAPTFNAVSETFIADHVRTLAPGATVPLRVEFADGRKLETQAKAVAAGDAGVE